MLPPSKDALRYHIFRSAYQAGWIWGNSLAQVTPPPPELWGWQLYKSYLKIYWTSLNIQKELDKAICTRQCRTQKCNKCKCSKNKTSCLKYCNCLRNCTNIWYCHSQPFFYHIKLTFYMCAIQLLVLICKFEENVLLLCKTHKFWLCHFPPDLSTKVIKSPLFYPLFGYFIKSLRLIWGQIST